ncbi:hypothetical protein B9Z55_021588 [Caenorhabditis nigoni]|uniref:Uncharacterized protein n=1 Tax=Caenorhabditis nigoni TaxID=1611254 RepID=A0A2G5TSL3_9PELO|nr:hypothetical protein B9Z55_021588 [Caenorhabditis nigoni]
MTVFKYALGWLMTDRDSEYPQGMLERQIRDEEVGKCPKESGLTKDLKECKDDRGLCALAKLLVPIEAVLGNIISDREDEGPPPGLQNTKTSYLGI